MLVSIIVVAWNSKSLIQAAIDNLAKSLNQDRFDGVDVIIVDDASTIEPIDGILFPQGLKGTEEFSIRFCINWLSNRSYSISG